MQLRGKRVLITGASGGIGREMVRAFVEEGAEVVAHCNRNRSGLEQLATELGSASIEIAQADLADETQVRQMFAGICGERPLECVVANAGKWPAEDQSVDRLELARWQSTMAANLTATFLTMKYFVGNVRQHQLETPAAVMIASTAGQFGEAGHSDYAAAKAAIAHGLLPSLKNELVRISPAGRVNVVSPGWTMTPMAEKFANDESAMQRAKQTIALRKFGTPRDMADAALFLCSPRSSHICGHVLGVDGGMEGRVLFAPQET